MTMYFYQGGFYDDSLSAPPDGAKEISDEFYLSLFEGQAEGKQIREDENGMPFLAEAPPSPYHFWHSKKKTWVISAAAQADFLAQRKTTLLTEIARKTDALKAQYLTGYSQAEIDSFYRQEQEARGELPLMILTEIFAGRSDLTDLEQLKAKVIEKADLFAIIMGKMFAIKQGFEVKIEQAQTLEELGQINEEINQWSI